MFLNIDQHAIGCIYCSIFLLYLIKYKVGMTLSLHILLFLPPRPRIQLSEVGMFQTCINLLSAMLAENVEIGGELHIERLYLFCLMWSFGGLLEDKDMKGFNDLLGTLSTAYVYYCFTLVLLPMWQCV